MEMKSPRHLISRKVVSTVGIRTQDESGLSVVKVCPANIVEMTFNSLK